MAFSDQEIIGRFPVGYYALHPNISLNFQMNRFWNWVGDQQMLDELREAGKHIVNYDDWLEIVTDLSDKALAADRRLPAAYCTKMAIFFLEPGDARVKPAIRRFLDTVLAENGITPASHHQVRYQKTHLGAYRLTPDRPRGTIVVFGGFDSYIRDPGTQSHDPHRQAHVHPPLTRVGQRPAALCLNGMKGTYLPHQRPANP